MADDQEKTEEPTSKKIEDARKDGNVPRSMDFAGLFTLFVAILAFLILFDFMSEHMQNLFRHVFGYIKTGFEQKDLVDLVFVISREFLLMVIPLATIVAIAGVLGTVAQIGFLFTVKPLIPDLKKLDPIKGLGNLFSMKKFIEAIKTTLKSFVSLGVGFFFFWIFIEELPTVELFGLTDQLQWLKDKALVIALAMLLVTFVFALADLLIVRFQYFKNLRMSKQEVKDEMKNMDGDPLIKQQIRQRQMQMSKKRMMSEVPSADVVVTNPTHYAVAIRYKEGLDNAPTVIAKGMNEVALKIKEVARENGVHILQNPPLARSLYKEVELDHPIPEQLYQAVAEVLAYVYKMNK